MSALGRKDEEMERQTVEQMEQQKIECWSRETGKDQVVQDEERSLWEGRLHLVEVVQQMSLAAGSVDRQKYGSKQTGRFEWPSVVDRPARLFS